MVTKHRGPLTAQFRIFLAGVLSLFRVCEFKKLHYGQSEAGMVWPVQSRGSATVRCVCRTAALAVALSGLSVS